MKQSKLYVLVRLPASGKSTFTNMISATTVSSDEIRECLYGDANIQDDPQAVS